MPNELILGGFIALALVLHTLWNRSSARREQRAQVVADDVSALGDDIVPASLHPLINSDICIGSGACVTGCPEHDVIGLLQGRGSLINPLGCIGHGACAAACPVDAITLVFGSKTRGIDIPLTNENFETNQPGVFIVGELGGMGLIRNAVSQGRQAAQHVITTTRRGAGDVLDAVIVGAGPAGISAALQLMQAGLRVLLVEREEFGGTIMHYPRNKVVMTGTLDFAIFGKVKARTMTKEQLVELWQEICESTKVPFVTGQLVEDLEQSVEGFWNVHTKEQNYCAANVLLALGRRGSPRKLGVPGEAQQKVVYRLLEPQKFADRDVLVVGGGNSAAECALALADYGGCASVSISYRRSEFARVRAEVRSRLGVALDNGRATSLMPTEVTEIGVDKVTLRQGDGAMVSIANDDVIVQIGGTPPTALLEKFGIETITKHAER